VIFFSILDAIAHCDLVASNFRPSVGRTSSKLERHWLLFVGTPPCRGLRLRIFLPSLILRKDSMKLAIATHPVQGGPHKTSPIAGNGPSNMGWAFESSRRPKSKPARSPSAQRCEDVLKPWMRFSPNRAFRSPRDGCLVFRLPLSVFRRSFCSSSRTRRSFFFHDQPDSHPGEQVKIKCFISCPPRNLRRAFFLVTR